MRFWPLFALVLILTSASDSNAIRPVIYGDDHRQEVHEAKPLYQTLAQSAATLVARSKLIKLYDSYMLKQETFSDWLGSVNTGQKFCSDERFTNQPVPGSCSGFLIAPDIIATAGHCAQMENFCTHYKWVFDFKLNPKTQDAGFDISFKNVYSCKKVVSNALSLILGMDYALVQLDRKVEDRAPLNYRTEGEIQDWTDVIVIGSPAGLPLKVTGGARVRVNEHPLYFSTNLDTYEGNSGSAVFDAQTGLVEGILVRGENDFVENKELQCMTSNRCDNSGCRGEDVSRISSIPEIAVMNPLYKAAQTGDLGALNEILSLNTWIDFYGADGESALIKAASSGQSEVIKLLLSHGADVNLTDSKGNTALHHLMKAFNLESLAILLEARVDVKKKNKQGQTALDLARMKGLDSTLELLLK